MKIQESSSHNHNPIQKPDPPFKIFFNTILKIQSFIQIYFKICFTGMQLSSFSQATAIS